MKLNLFNLLKGKRSVIKKNINGYADNKTLNQNN